ncbi:hypothetical protein CSB37_02085 [bacterium DOLZORAL124_38_8]|nr:MAG: hypothetical protein CSB37_02085 [bacterium DOLZORAL124_38_8]
MGLEGFKYNENNESNNNKVETKKSVDWKLISENVALKTKLAANEALANKVLAENYIDNAFEELPSDVEVKDVRNESVEYQFGVAVNNNPGLKGTLMAFFSGSGKKESEANFAAMNDVMNDTTKQLGRSSMNGFDAVV